MTITEATSPALAKRWVPRRQLKDWLSPTELRLVVLGGAFALWEAAAWFGDPLFIAPPSRIIAAVGKLAQDPNVAGAVLIVISQILAGFAISVVIGIGLGLIVASGPFVRRCLFPIVLMLYATPSVVFVPILVIWFGLGFESKVVLGVLNGIWPIAVSVVNGVEGINPSLRTAALSMGASRRQIFTTVVFPNLVPSLFTGMRLAMTATMVGVLLAELYASQGGFGYYTHLYSSIYLPANVFALVGMISIFAIAVNEVMRRLEIYFNRWRG